MNKLFLVILILLPLPALAVIANVRVSGATATQVVIAYTAPNDQACSLQVSESPTYLPLVHDVDEALFSGSSSDARSGSLADGRMRVVVIGKHGMMATGAANQFSASDGNRYSRALEANTKHYFKISCGIDQFAGEFTTGNIPLGSTFPEPLAADQTKPGTYNWPTAKNPSDRNESWVDPNTGSLIRKLTLPTDSNDYPNLQNSWPSGGMFQLCSHQVVESGGHTYNLCYMPNTYAILFSIETDTGAVYPLSRVFLPYGQTPCSSSGTVPVPNIAFSPTDPRRIYFTSNCGVGIVAWTGKWAGPLNVANSVLAKLPVKQAALELTLLTPTGLPALLTAFDPSFDATQRANLPVMTMDGVQNGHLIFHVVSQQDSLGWIFVFDPGNALPIGAGGSGGVIAANPFWKAPVSRWCSLHTLMPAGDNNPWITVTSNSPGRYGEGGFMGSRYSVTVADDAGTGNIIKIAPTNGSYEPQSTVSAPYYLQDAEPGDLFWVNSIGPYGVEPVELVSKDPSNHTWTVIRGDNLGQSKFIQGSNLTPNSVKPVHITAGMKLYAGCRGTSFNSRIAWLSALWYWNYVNDPHGTSITYPAVNGTSSNQVVENYATGGHAVTRDSVNVMGYGNSEIPSGWIRWTYANATPGYDLVETSKVLNANPSFASVKPPVGYQGHASFDQMQASEADQQWFVDALPMVNGAGSGTPYSATGTLVSGQSSTYKMTGAVLHRKQTTTLGSCGVHPLVDISGTAGSWISDSTPYTYCVAGAAGECRPGSTQGDVFVSCPGATKLTCDVNSQTGVTDICIGDSAPYGNGAVQVSSRTQDKNGGSGRLISHLFATHHNEWIYNNVRPTSNGTWLLFQSANPTGRLEGYLAKLPPFPTAQSTRRDSFVPIGVSFATYPGATNAIVEFGYAENGDPAKFYCTSRQETCVAQSNAIDESQPFYYAETEARFITGAPASCAAPARLPLGVRRPATCTIAVPAVPGRILYYRVVYRNSAGAVVGSQKIAAQAVP